MGRLSPRHDHALARTPGDWSHPSQTAQRVVVPPPYRVAAFGNQRGEHLGADTGQRPQDSRIRQLFRRWIVLRGRVGVVRRSSLGEPMHQPVEFAPRVTGNVGCGNCCTRLACVRSGRTASTWPPSAAVRHCSIAAITRRCAVEPTRRHINLVVEQTDYSPVGLIWVLDKARQRQLAGESIQGGSGSEARQRTARFGRPVRCHPYH